jgi:hypothetical protein
MIIKLRWIMKHSEMKYFGTMLKKKSGIEHIKMISINISVF